MQANKYYGWTLLAVLWCILFVNLAFPAIGCSSVVNAYMAADLQLDRKTLGLVFSVFMMMTGLPGPLVAVFINKTGARLTMVAGSIILVIGSVIMATAVNTGTMAVVIFGFVVGTGVMVGGILASQTCIAHWFVRRRAMALSILFSAGSIGGMVSAPLLDHLISTHANNWRLAWWLVAGLAVITTIVSALFIRNKPEDMGQLPDGGKAGAPENGAAGGQSSVYITDEVWTFGESLKTPCMWLLMLGMLGLSGGYALFMGHGVIHLKDLGHSPAMAASAISVMVVGDLLAKAVIATLGDRVEPRFIWSAITFIFAIGMLLVVNAHSVAIAYASAICIGAGFGGGVVLIMTVLGNYYGSAIFASVTGIALAFQTTISAIVPVVGGYYYDINGNYALSFYWMAALSFAGAVILLLIRPPRKNPTATGHVEAIVQPGGEQAE